MGLEARDPRLRATCYLEKRRTSPSWPVEEQAECRLMCDHDEGRAKIDDKDFELYLVVLGPSIICFMKSIAASAVGWPAGVAMYSASVSV